MKSLLKKFNFVFCLFAILAISFSMGNDVKAQSAGGVYPISGNFYSAPGIWGYRGNAPAGCFYPCVSGNCELCIAVLEYGNGGGGSGPGLTYCRSRQESDLAYKETGCELGYHVTIEAGSNPMGEDCIVDTCWPELSAGGDYETKLNKYGLYSFRSNVFGVDEVVGNFCSDQKYKAMCSIYSDECTWVEKKWDTGFDGSECCDNGDADCLKWPPDVTDPTPDPDPEPEPETSNILGVGLPPALSSIDVEGCIPADGGLVEKLNTALEASVLKGVLTVVGLDKTASSYSDKLFCPYYTAGFDCTPDENLDTSVSEGATGYHHSKEVYYSDASYLSIINYLKNGRSITGDYFVPLVDFKKKFLERFKPSSGPLEWRPKPFAEKWFNALGNCHEYISIDATGSIKEIASIYQAFEVENLKDIASYLKSKGLSEQNPFLGYIADCSDSNCFDPEIFKYNLCYLYNFCTKTTPAINYGVFNKSEVPGYIQRQTRVLPNIASGKEDVIHLETKKVVFTRPEVGRVTEYKSCLKGDKDSSGAETYSCSCGLDYDNAVSKRIGFGDAEVVYYINFAAGKDCNSLSSADFGDCGCYVEGNTNLGEGSLYYLEVFDADGKRIEAQSKKTNAVVACPATCSNSSAYESDSSVAKDCKADDTRAACKDITGLPNAICGGFKTNLNTLFPSSIAKLEYASYEISQRCLKENKYNLMYQYKNSDNNQGVISVMRNTDGNETYLKFLTGKTPGSTVSSDLLKFLEEIKDPSKKYEKSYDLTN